jgi:thymidylate synthase (FAD)
VEKEEVVEVEFLESPSTVDLISFTGLGDDMVALSAWVSFNADDEKRLENRKQVRGLIRFLRRENHMTPFEHSIFTFRVTCPIFTARELFRHRSAAYNEQSGRYTIFEPKFYLPAMDRPAHQEGKAGAYKFSKAPEWKMKAARGAITSVTKVAWKAYEYMVYDLGIAKEVARMVLPVNLMTTFYVTMSARNLMHFLELRTSEQALYEIRDPAHKMEEFFKKEMPLTHEAWVSKNQEWAEFQEWKQQKEAA